MEKVVISPESGKKVNPFKSFASFFRDAWIFRDLVKVLIIRNLTSEFKQSALGSVWIILTPLTGVLSWFVLHFANVLKPGETEVPYPAYVFMGSMIWGYFLDLFIGASHTLRIYKPLVIHLRFPRSVLYLERILLSSINFSITFVVSVLVLSISGVPISHSVVFIPVVITPLIMFGLSLGIFSSMLIVLSYEFKRVIAGGIGLLLYFMPVVYTRDSVDNRFILSVLDLNPFTYLVCSIRDIVFNGEFYDLKGYLVSSLVSFLVMFWAVGFLEKRERKMIERVV